MTHTLKNRFRNSGYEANRGFTLIEMLVAITIFSLVLVLLSGSFYLADNSRRTSRNQMDALEGLRQTQRLLDRYLGAMQAVWQGEGDDKSLLFEGREDSLVFVSAMPAHLGASGLYEIRLRVLGETDSKQLQFERQLLHPQRYSGDSADKDSRPSILLHQAKDVVFSYYGSSDESLGAGWYERWPSSRLMPSLVKLSIHQPGDEIITLNIRTAASTSALTPAIAEYTGYRQ